MKRIYPLLISATLSFLAAIYPICSEAEAKVARVGILAPRLSMEWLAPFHRALREQGWVEGKNIKFEYRDAAGDPGRMPQLADELVQLNVDVIFPVGPPAVRAAFSATRNIPIVAHDFETDPVAAGYARTYAKPSGNLTGLFLDSPELAGKWLELLKSIVPALSQLVVLWDASSGPVHLEAVRTLASGLGIRLQVLEIRVPGDIDNAGKVFQGRPQAMIILPSPMMFFEATRLARLARRHRLPATSMFVQFADAGGMLVYGPDNPASAETCGNLVAKILSGSKPGDLPIERPIKFEFIVNLRTAKALRLSVPDGILLRADRIIR